MSETPKDGAAPEELLVGEVLTDRIEQVDLQTEMQRSYLDYAMAVIIGRALPDVRDGL
jgi:DNA gyrase subunit A